MLVVHFLRDFRGFLCNECLQCQNIWWFEYIFLNLQDIAHRIRNFNTCVYLVIK